MTDQANFQEVGEDFLEHFGKKGMRWGRRSGSSSTSKSKSTKTSKQLVPAQSKKERIKAGLQFIAVVAGLTALRATSVTYQRETQLGRQYVDNNPDPFDGYIT